MPHNVCNVSPYRSDLFAVKVLEKLGGISSRELTLRVAAEYFHSDRDVVRVVQLRQGVSDSQSMECKPFELSVPRNVCHLAAYRSQVGPDATSDTTFPANAVANALAKMDHGWSHVFDALQTSNGVFDMRIIVHVQEGCNGSVSLPNYLRLQGRAEEVLAKNVLSL